MGRRRQHSMKFKARVALEAAQGLKIRTGRTPSGSARNECPEA
jgi:hypothetical protein